MCVPSALHCSLNIRPVSPWKPTKCYALFTLTLAPSRWRRGWAFHFSLAYKWAEPPEPGLGSINPLGRMSVIIAAAKEDRPVKWLCRKAGGFFVKNPAA